MLDSTDKVWRKRFFSLRFSYEQRLFAKTGSGPLGWVGKTQACTGRDGEGAEWASSAADETAARPRVPRESDFHAPDGGTDRLERRRGRDRPDAGGAERPFFGVDFL